MAKDNLETVRQLYEQLMASGRLEDDANAEMVPRFFDPEVEIHQSSAIVGTAGDFHGYRGAAESAREIVREFVNPAFVAEEMKTIGEQVVVAARFCATGRRSGAAVEAPVGHLFTLRDVEWHASRCSRIPPTRSAPPHDYERRSTAQLRRTTRPTRPAEWPQRRPAHQALHACAW